MDGRMDRWIDGSMDGSMDGSIDRSIDLIPLLSEPSPWALLFLLSVSTRCVCLLYLFLISVFTSHFFLL